MRNVRRALEEALYENARRNTEHERFEDAAEGALIESGIGFTTDEFIGLAATLAARLKEQAREEGFVL